MSDDIQFNIINQDVLERLRRDGEVHLPKKKLSVPRDERWNMKQMNSRLILGLELGHSVYDIADSMMDVVDNNEASAIRNARTMVTEAENGGRLDSYRNLESQGVEMVKYWMATADDRVRPSHQDIDGEQKPINEPFSNGCMYPGDNRGPSEEVWMCRCSMGTHVVGFKRSDGSISEIGYPDEPIVEDNNNDIEDFMSNRKSQSITMDNGQVLEHYSIKDMQSVIRDFRDIEVMPEDDLLSILYDNGDLEVYGGGDDTLDIRLSSIRGAIWEGANNSSYAGKGISLINDDGYWRFIFNGNNKD